MHWTLDNICNEDYCYFKGETMHISFNGFKKLSFSIHMNYVTLMGGLYKNFDEMALWNDPDGCSCDF